MHSIKEEDLNLSELSLNLLNAILMGRFYYYEILLTLNEDQSARSELLLTQDHLKLLDSWRESLPKGDPLLSHSWKILETENSKLAADLFVQIKVELYGLANKIIETLEVVELFSRKDLMLFLSACFARYSYGRSIYLDGVDPFRSSGQSSSQGKEVIADLKAAASEEVDLAYTTICSISDSFELLNNNFMRAFVARCAPLPGMFRTYCHEINKLLAPFNGGLNFENADFNEEQAVAWSLKGFDAEQAGYWRAYSLSPDQALAWLEEDIDRPALAMPWKYHGFSAAEAKYWISQNVLPLQATELRGRNLNDQSRFG